MRIHRRIRNLTKPEQEQFETYLEKKLATLEPILQAHYPDDDTVHIFANIQKHKKHTAFDYECILEMPRKRITGSEVKHTITEVLDFTTDRLMNQLVKHLKKTSKA